MIWRLEAKIVDVETAFLEGILEEEVFMDIPEGYKEEAGPNKCLQLQKSIYGLVQAARQYYKKFIGILRKIGFTGGYADPCLMTWKSKFGIVFISIWVDDSLLIGTNEAINETIKQLKEYGLKLTVEENLKDYLSCEITISDDGKTGWIHQPHLIKKLEAKFGHLVKGMKNYNTPGTPGSAIIRGIDEKISAEDQKLYRSGVGMLLYLVKHTRPDIANAVQELSKVLDGASPAAFKEIDTKI